MILLLLLVLYAFTNRILRCQLLINHSSSIGGRMVKLFAAVAWPRAGGDVELVINCAWDVQEEWQELSAFVGDCDVAMFGDCADYDLVVQHKGKEWGRILQTSPLKGCTQNTRYPLITNYGLTNLNTNPVSHLADFLWTTYNANLLFIMICKIKIAKAIWLSMCHLHSKVGSIYTD